MANKMKKALIAYLAVIILVLAGCSEGVRNLITVAKSQAEAEKMLDEETDTYGRVKNAICKNKIRIGQSADAIRAKYGEPVVVIDEDEYHKWVYKPGYADYFSHEKVYLFFDDEGVLKDIESLGVCEVNLE